MMSESSNLSKLSKPEKDEGVDLKELSDSSGERTSKIRNRSDGNQATQPMPSEKDAVVDNLSDPPQTGQISEGSPIPRLNLDDVINAITGRPEGKDLQHVEDLRSLQSPSRAAGKSPMSPDAPFRSNRESPIVSLMDFRHPDFPTDDILNQPRPKRPIAWTSIGVAIFFAVLSVVFVLVICFHKGLTEPDPSTLVYMKPLPPFKPPIES